MIQLVDITKRCGEARTLALDGVSLSLQPKERLALVGENGAGKTTLMNVLYGLYQPDAGEVRFEGQAVKLSSPRDALRRGVGMVHQHFTLVPTLTVAENVVLGHEPRRNGLLDVARAEREVAQTCAKFGFQLDVRAVVSTLTVGSQQKVEIVKALHRGATTLILDEPTAVLTPQETADLFRVMRTLSEGGLTVVLISHKLADVLSFATRIAVLRRGKLVSADVKPAEIDASGLARLMVGELAAAPAVSAASEGVRGEVRLQLDGAGAGEKVKGVTLEVHAGEIVGVAGVDGNGQQQLVELVAGLRPLERGAMRVCGVDAHGWSAAKAREAGVAHVPEDRHLRGMVGEMNAEENVALGRQQKPPFSKGPWIDFIHRTERALKLMKEADVRPPEPKYRMGSLSGGNQQKLVVARELDAQPKLLLVVQPTRGLDFAAVEAVRSRLLAAKAAGCAVLLVSMDLDEVLGLSDRVVVMYDGRVNGEVKASQANAKQLGEWMLGAAHG